MENSFMCSKVRLINSSPVYSVVFSPNGEYLASGSQDYTSVCGGYRVENTSIHSQDTPVESTA